MRQVMMGEPSEGIQCQNCALRFSVVFDFCTCSVRSCKLTIYLAAGPSPSSLSCLTRASTAHEHSGQVPGTCSLEWVDVLEQSGAEDPRLCGLNPASICSNIWDWRYPQLLLLGPGPIATHLMKRSLENFSKITFEDLVTTAGGYKSPALESFSWTYDVLEWKVYSTFIKNLNRLDLLVELKETLKEITADPFVLRAVERAWQGVTLNRSLGDEEGEVDDQPLDLFIKPLGDFLAHTEFNARDIKLRVLRTRFYRQYHCIDVCWRAFDTSTKFLEQLQSLSTFSLAKVLSWEDEAIFGEYLEGAFTSEKIHGSAESPINFRWNLLSREVEECIAGGTEISLKLDCLAEELFRIHNEYSLTAVLQGFLESGLETPALRKFGMLVKSDRNYQTYRQHMQHMQHMELYENNGTLYFPFPAIANCTRGDWTLAKMVLRGYNAFQIEAEQESWLSWFGREYFGCFGS